MTVRLFCPAARCISRGWHNPDCYNRTCGGCRPRPADEPSQLCAGHGTALHNHLADLPQLLNAVNDPHTTVAYRHYLDPAGRVIELAPDPIAAAMPAGPVSGQRGQPRVSGTHGAPVPISLDRFDLTAPPHRGPVTDPYHDQTGHIPAAALMGEWVDAIIEQRGMREHRPVSTVPILTQWLINRFEWILADHNHLLDLADEAATLHHHLQHAAGLARLIHLLDAPCPSCDLLTLIRNNGSDYVECTHCGLHWNETQYERLVLVAVAGLVA